eukprot:CAMPEP_0181275528 /NCGR_PEP_ID=MMETSP1097-20121128/9937_1 /TAXON_ID=35684 /ORGANISM="Pseudopedinella elastica, Strain CCMP716" /LENGTH=34 /DNA_ID= /DNA_START= /DNA_END= /DNA_ORIENTATION=
METMASTVPQEKLTVDDRGVRSFKSQGVPSEYST